MKILQKLLLALALLIGFVDAQAQFALKTNLLYDATTTPNLGAEVAVGSRSTLNSRSNVKTVKRRKIKRLRR